MSDINKFLLEGEDNSEKTETDLFTSEKSVLQQHSSNKHHAEHKVSAEGGFKPTYFTDKILSKPHSENILCSAIDGDVTDKNDLEIEPNNSEKEISAENEFLTEKQKRSHSRKASECAMAALDASKRLLMKGKENAYNFFCFVVKFGANLKNYWDLPTWLQDNDFIWHLHRPQLESFKLCFKSMFSLHSETINIWSHVIGVVITFVCALYIFIRPNVTKDGYPYYPKTVVEYIVFSCFFLSSCVCMTFSWLFHTLGCHSEKVKTIFAKMDYTGISLLITGSTVPVIYYGYYCQMKIFYIYLSCILVLCSGCIFVSFWKVVGTPRFRPLRATVFLVFGLSNIIPICHAVYVYGYWFVVNALSLYALIVMGSLYVFGALLYSFRVPERFCPGRINFIFQSHQIFHVCVVVAVMVHLYALCDMASFRARAGSNCSFVRNNTRPVLYY